MSKFKKSNLSFKKSFEIAIKKLTDICEKEKTKESPNYDLLAAYAALGQCFCQMHELVQSRIAISLSMTIDVKGSGDNMVLMLGDSELIGKCNDMLISVMQQELIEQMHEGGNQ